MLAGRCPEHEPDFAFSFRRSARSSLPESEWTTRRKTAASPPRRLRVTHEFKTAPPSQPASLPQTSLAMGFLSVVAESSALRDKNAWTPSDRDFPLPPFHILRDEFIPPGWRLSQKRRQLPRHCRESCFSREACAAV